VRNNVLQEHKSKVRIASMKSRLGHSKLSVLLFVSRPKFLIASAAPVFVGSALGYVTAGAFSPVLFILALLAIMALHSGANIANDYFDHLSGNDWVNKNPTPFSGGRRYIQEGILSPKATLLAGLFWLTIGSIIGVVIFLLTQSFFILILGIIGLLGGFFYTAPPVKLGYRYFGELVIALLFGLLPVYGSYYLQTKMIDVTPILPAVIVSTLIVLVILINEFPDLKADAAVNKKTLVVLFGVRVSIWIYRAVLVAGFVIAIAMLIYRPMFYAGLFYLFSLPVGILAIRFANEKDLTTPGRYRASQITVFLHALGCLFLSAGLVIHGFFNPPL
jgi:1,4-dihydroxy-2-naphthoate octaprenyltransferase